MVKLNVGPGNPGPADAPSTSPGIGIEIWLPAAANWNNRIHVLGGGGWAGGATVKAGFGVLGVSGTVSRLDPDAGDAVWSGGATANMKVFGGPLVPIAVTLQGGAGYVAPEFRCLSPGACDIKEWHFPVGLGVSFTIPNPALAIKPQVACLILTRWQLAYPAEAAAPLLVRH